MKKGTVIEGVIERLDHPNKGILTADGDRVTVKNTLPGQKVRAVVTKGRAGRAEARLLEVLEASPLETAEQPCPHFGVCGGCQYQTLPYETQLAIKGDQVRRLLMPVLGENLPFEGVAASPRVEGYRNKMEFSFGDFVKDGPLSLGMHRRGSFYDIVTVDQCRIVDEDYRKILRCVLDFYTERGIPFYRKMQRTGVLRHLVVRKAARTGEILILLVTTSAYQVGEELVEILRALPLEGEIAGILQAWNDSPADVVRSDRMFCLYGRDFFYEELLGLRFRITPFSFFQTNSLGAEVLYSVAREYVGSAEGQRVYDLYSGTGTIAQILAPVAKEVIGVEIVEEAVAAARENAAENGLANCRFLAGDVLKVLDEIEEKPDLIVLDPPRDGVHPKALRKILDYGVERIVYISCKPTSLARDLVSMTAAGYQVRRVRCVDMFPATGGIETVAMMEMRG